MIKTPKFWTEKNLSSRLICLALWPFSAIYFLGFFLIKIFSRPQKISKPVICVGNLIAGGSGKTPTAIAIGKILREMEVEFAFLSRGYMNDGAKFLRLSQSDGSKANKVGDEPLLLLETAPTFVAKNRFFGARQIENMKKFSAILLDDGMQNNSLKSDFLILVVDGKIGFGNEMLLPAGPMREPLGIGLKKADLTVVVGDVGEEVSKKLAGKKIINAKIVAKNSADFLQKKLIAFCGLAFPHKFFSFLENEGLQLVETCGFSDHHSYSISELKNLCRKAEEKNATLVTTKKDWVKFPESFQKKISYLDIELELENKELIKDELKKVFAKFS